MEMRYFQPLVIALFFACACAEEAPEFIEVSSLNVLPTADNTYNITFTVSNPHDSPKTATYSVLVYDQFGIGDVSSEYYPDQITLASGQSQDISIIYEAPEIVKGTYDLWVLIKDEAGMQIGQAVHENTTFEGDGAMVNIVLDSCTLTNLDNTRAVSLSKGFDIVGTDAILTCDIKSASDSSLTVLAMTITETKDGPFADTIGSVTVAPGATAKLAMALALPEEPGFYKARLSLLDENSVELSMPILFAYEYVADIGDQEPANNQTTTGPIESGQEPIKPAVESQDNSMVYLLIAVIIAVIAALLYFKKVRK